MNAARHHIFSLDEYFGFEMQAETRFEFCDGAILAMAGGAPRHNRVAMNAAAALHRREGPCRAFGSDQRIGTGDGVYTYPDAMVVCGQLELTMVHVRRVGTEWQSVVITSLEATVQLLSLPEPTRLVEVYARAFDD